MKHWHELTEEEKQSMVKANQDLADQRQSDLTRAYVLIAALVMTVIICAII